MINDLVFHLGDRKTGSTSIQHTLNDKLWSSGSKSLFYAAKGHNGPLANVLLDMGKHQNVAKRYLGLAERLSRATADVAVVSTESFEDVSPKALKSTLEEHLPHYMDRVRLIAYVRPHGPRVLSGYAEQIKRGQSTATLEEYFAEGVAFGRFESAERFARWREEFGDAFTLRPMIRSELAGACVVRDFIGYALQSDDFDLDWDPNANPSLSQEDLVLLQGLHTRLEDQGVTPDQASFLGAALGQQMAAVPAGDGTRLTLSPKLAADVKAHCAADAAALDAMFFEGTPMSADLDGLADKAAEAQAAPNDVDARVMGLFSDWLSGLKATG